MYNIAVSCFHLKDALILQSKEDKNCLRQLTGVVWTGGKPELPIQDVTWQRKYLKQNSESGLCIPKILSASFTLFSSVLNAQIEKTRGELGNSFSSTVNSTEARPWCKTLRCLHQATGSEDSQGELSLFTSGKNSCRTGLLLFSALRSALWILPSAFLMRGPCMSEGAGLSLRACFLNCEFICWVKKFFNPCVL